jgi:hypothetical protein
LASKKKSFTKGIDELFKAAYTSSAASLAEELNKPSKLLDLFNDPDQPVKIPMKQMVGTFKLAPGEMNPILQPLVSTFSYSKVQDPNSFAGTATGGSLWQCGCKDEPKVYGMTQFKCHKPGNHCYRERFSG